MGRSRRKAVPCEVSEPHCLRPRGRRPCGWDSPRLMPPFAPILCRGLACYGKMGFRNYKADRAVPLTDGRLADRVSRRFDLA